MKARVMITSHKELGWRHVYYESEKDFETKEMPWYVGVCHQERREILVRPDTPVTSGTLGGADGFETEAHWLLALVQHVAHFGHVERSPLPKQWVNLDDFAEKLNSELDEIGLRGRWTVTFDVDSSGDAAFTGYRREKFAGVVDWPPLFGRER